MQVDHRAGVADARSGERLEREEARDMWGQVARDLKWRRQEHKQVGNSFLPPKW